MQCSSNSHSVEYGNLKVHRATGSCSYGGGGAGVEVGKKDGAMYRRERVVRWWGSAVRLTGGLCSCRCCWRSRGVSSPDKYGPEHEYGSRLLASPLRDAVHLSQRIGRRHTERRSRATVGASVRVLRSSGLIDAVRRRERKRRSARADLRSLRSSR